MIELQDIIRTHRDGYLQNHRVSALQLKVMNAVTNCRTAVLGAHIDRCDECGYEQISYNSCRNRHCPKWRAYACLMQSKCAENPCNVRVFGTKCGGEGGIWTLARFLHAYSLSRGAPSASWVLLHLRAAMVCGLDINGKSSVVGNNWAIGFILKQITDY